MAAANRTPLVLFTEPEFLSLASVQLARGMARSTILIALALYADLFLVSGVVAGLFGSAYAVSRLLLVLPIGRAVDLGDAKRSLLIGLGLNGLVLLGFILINSPMHVVVLRFVQGLSSIIIVIAGTTVVGEISPVDERGLWIGTHKQTKAFSSLTGDIVGGLLLFIYGFAVAYAVLFVITGIAVITVSRFLRSAPGGRVDPDDNTGIETLQHLFQQRSIQALVIFRFTFSFAQRAVTLFLPVYARVEFGMNPLAIGAVLAGGKLTKALLQGRIGRYSDRVGRLPWFVAGGALLYAIGTALIPLAPYAAVISGPLHFGVVGTWVTLDPAFFGLFLAYAILGVADSLRIPTSNTLFVNEGQRLNAVAASLSLRSIPAQLGAVIGPVAIGGLVDLLSFTVAFWVAAGFAVVACTLFISLCVTGIESIWSVQEGK